MNKELQDLKSKWENFNPDDYAEADGSTKESLQEKYDRFKEVYDTITIRELNLIWYLRGSRGGVDMSFLAAAKLHYEAHQALHTLFATE